MVTNPLVAHIKGVGCLIRRGIYLGGTIGSWWRAIKTRSMRLFLQNLAGLEEGNPTRHKLDQETTMG